MTIPYRSLACAIAFCVSTTASAQTVYVDQGDDWSWNERNSFYTTDQGARLIPLAWARAIKAPDGSGFLDDALARYGYLPMPGRSDADVPVGFTVAPLGGEDSLGMTCAACHTREIEVNGTHYRIDGGPAVVDFQAFLAELDAGVIDALKPENFDAFATSVLGSDATKEQIGLLEAEVKTWSDTFHVYIERSLPNPGWGPSRLDAVTMIFNRLAGLDLGKPEDNYLIADNIVTADAPTRYPFLWNAARQDYTQWPGFSANGDALLGLARNLGEVYGVFGVFHPQKQTGLFKLDRDYISENSANFTGLKALEELIRDIGKPEWPWELNASLAAQGQAIYERPTDSGGCVDCHGIKKGEFRPFAPQTTWATPRLDVGTDTRECGVLLHTVETGVMEGATIPLIFGDPLPAEAPAFQVLAMATLGAIIQHEVGEVASMDVNVKGGEHTPDLPDEVKALLQATAAGLQAQQKAAEANKGVPPCVYESRVMEGIWAAAPYLHNGSVPTLAALLEPADKRPMTFKLGPSYDVNNVGLAKEQSMFDYTLTVTGCDDRNSGNSNCGHEYGTTLPPAEKRALLEYLKSL